MGQAFPMLNRLQCRRPKDVNGIEVSTEYSSVHLCAKKGYPEGCWAYRWCQSNVPLGEKLEKGEGAVAHLQSPEPPTSQPCCSCFSVPALLPASPRLTPLIEEVHLPWNKLCSFGLQQMRICLWDWDKPGSDRAVEDFGWKMYLEATKPWTNLGPYLSFQHWPASASRTSNNPSADWILQLQDGTPIFCHTAGMGWLWAVPHARGSTSFVNDFWLFIFGDNASSHILISRHDELLHPQSHRPVFRRTSPIHGNTTR